jgi:ribosomal protein S18 acetylase RimI-like enzyme
VVAAQRSPNQKALPLPVVRRFDFGRDIEAVLRFQVETYERNFPGFRVTESFLRDYRRQLKRMARTWTEGLFVVEQEGQARAFIWVGLISTLVSPCVGYIKNLYVEPGLRRTGWGRELVRVAEGWCRDRGASQVELDASVCNAEAMRLYERCGYRAARIRMVRDL